MTWNDIFTDTFKSLSERLGHCPSRQSMVEQCLSEHSDLCRTAVEWGWLTSEQMSEAARRYLLGRSKSGRTIFWMIDDLGIVRDGHIGQGWVSQMLKARYPDMAGYIHARHCLFGLHLASLSDQPVAIVKSEAAAVILSMLFPECIWLSYAYTANFTTDLLQPLQGRRVTIYPQTDEVGNTYVFFLEQADRIRRVYDIGLSVSRLLEVHASEEQKARDIDLLDFLLESRGLTPLSGCALPGQE